MARAGSGGDAAVFSDMMCTMHIICIMHIPKRGQSRETALSDRLERELSQEEIVIRAQEIIVL